MQTINFPVKKKHGRPQKINHVIWHRKNRVTPIRLFRKSYIHVRSFIRAFINSREWHQQQRQQEHDRVTNFHYRPTKLGNFLYHNPLRHKFDLFS